MNRLVQYAPVLLVVLVIAWLPAARAEGLKKLLMLDITPQGVSAEVTASLTDLMELEIERGRLYEVISQQDLRTLVKLEEQKLLLGKDEKFNERLAGIAKQVDAPFVLASTLGKVGQAHLLSLELMDTQEFKVLRRVNQTLVGEEQELIGSLRSAVLAITLEEKGVAPDISEELIDDLHIAEKPKSVYLSFSPAYEVPLGRKQSVEGFPAFRPNFLHFRLDAEFPVWKWIRLFGMVSIGTTVSESIFTEDNHLTGIVPSGEDEAKYFRLQAAKAGLDYSALRVPLVFGAKLVPERGRFLPYALAGIGLSWEGYSFHGGIVEVVRERVAGESCPAPFEEFTMTGGVPGCIIENQLLDPEGDVSSFGFDAIAAAGFELLLSHHLGIKAEVRYHFTYFFKSTSDLRVNYTGESEEYVLTTPDGDETVKDRYLEVFAVQNLHERLVFSLGLVAYW